MSSLPSSICGCVKEKWTRGHSESHMIYSASSGHDHNQQTPLRKAALGKHFYRPVLLQEATSLSVAPPHRSTFTQPELWSVRNTHLSFLNPETGQWSSFLEGCSDFPGSAAARTITGWMGKSCRARACARGSLSSLSFLQSQH